MAGRGRVTASRVTPTSMVAEVPADAASGPVQVVSGALDRLVRTAHALGSPLKDPFMTLSFLALPLIPELKISDRCLVDVSRFRPVSLFAE